jgi:hypothetical protein
MIICQALHLHTYYKKNITIIICTR